jgi:hypothetical protein
MIKFRVEGSGFRVESLGLKVECREYIRVDLECRVVSCRVDGGYRVERGGGPW